MKIHETCIKHVSFHANFQTVNLKNFTLAYEPDEVMMYRYIFPNEDVSPWAPIRVSDLLLFYTSFSSDFVATF